MWHTHYPATLISVLLNTDLDRMLMHTYFVRVAWNGLLHLTGDLFFTTKINRDNLFVQNRINFSSDFELIISCYDINMSYRYIKKIKI